MINNKPIVCISSSSNYVATGASAPRELILKDNYADAIAKAGAVPIIAAERSPSELAALCDCLLLSGGVDLDPHLFGEEIINETVKIDSMRDDCEYALLREFMALKKPVLGICRGSQIINCFLGGTLYQDIPSQLGGNHSDGIIHTTKASRGSVLCNLFGEDFYINSFHHQCANKLGMGLTVTATSPDGIVEAFEHVSLPVWGVQFHPERLTGAGRPVETPDFAPFFEHFINLTK